MNFNNGVHFIGAKECKFRYKGKNLIEYRRAELRPIAKALGINEIDGTKNDLLRSIISRASALKMDDEIARQ